MPPVVAGPQKTAAQHRRQRQGDEARNQNSHRDGDRELMQQPAYNAAHEQHRNENGHQRDRHGDDREADFARRQHRRLHARLAHLHVADDILKHDDGIIHHESHRQREPHQREVVQTVPEQVHHREGAHDRQRNRHARNQRGREFRRNRKITITTRHTVSISVNSTS